MRLFFSLLLVRCIFAKCLCSTNLDTLTCFGLYASDDISKAKCINMVAEVHLIGRPAAPLETDTFEMFAMLREVLIKPRRLCASMLPFCSVIPISTCDCPATNPPTAPPKRPNTSMIAVPHDSDPLKGNCHQESDVGEDVGFVSGGLLVGMLASLLCYKLRLVIVCQWVKL